MTASLYQSASSAGRAASTTAAASAAGRSSFIGGGASEEIVEIALAAQARAQVHHMRRAALRVQADIVARAVPEEVRFAQQVMHLVGLAGLQSEGFEIDFHPAALRMVRVEVDDADDDVQAIRRGL